MFPTFAAGDKLYVALPIKSSKFGQSATKAMTALFASTAGPPRHHRDEHGERCRDQAKKMTIPPADRRASVYRGRLFPGNPPVLQIVARMVAKFGFSIALSFGL
jgi:hypothetical protein